MQDLDVDRRSRVGPGAITEDRRRPLQELSAPLRDLARMHVELLGQPPSVFSPLMAAIATFALKAGLWFRRGRFVMVAPRFSANLLADLERPNHSAPLSRFPEPPLFTPNASKRHRSHKIPARAFNLVAKFG